MNKVFNNSETVVEGWYWALPSAELKIGKIKAVTLMGRELALYRGEDGKAHALDAYCSHMGAHLAEGWVDNNAVRCVFHNWKYGPDGRCVDAPCFAGRPPETIRQKTWPVEEKYGLLWVWTGEQAKHPVPCPPELEAMELESTLGGPFTKRCHPHVLLINAIDENHFASVHHLPVPLRMAPREIDSHAVEFANTTRWPKDRRLSRFLGRFYKGPATYRLTYWNATTGAVTLGPDFLHFYVMFTLRPNGTGPQPLRGSDINSNPQGLLGYLWQFLTFGLGSRWSQAGGSEGYVIAVTKKRPGLSGWLANRLILLATKLVAQYFAVGDTWVFRSIRFRFKTPVAADHAILDFVRHTNSQPVSTGWPDHDSSMIRSRPSLSSWNPLEDVCSVGSKE